MIATVVAVCRRVATLAVATQPVASQIVAIRRVVSPDADRIARWPDLPIDFENAALSNAAITALMTSLAP